MTRSPRLERALGPLLVLLPPLVVAALWTWAVLRIVAQREQAIAPINGGGFAPFVQLAWSWNHGLGWLQTVRWETARTWWWDQHWGPLFVPVAWLSHWLDGPWALCRIQGVLVGTGCLWAWLLGWAEARLPGGFVGLLLYAGSAPLLLVATADFQLLALALPLLPLAVWSARHASLPLFLALALLLGAAREELLVLLPLIGLCGGLPRAALGALLAAGWALLLHHTAGFLADPCALQRVAEASLAQGAGPASLPAIDWGHYLPFAGAAGPWLPLAPLLAVGAWGVAAFQYLPGTEFVTNPGWSFLHHLAPLVGLACCGGIVGAGRLMRALPRLRLLVLLVVALGSAWSWRSWQPELRPRLAPLDPTPHAAWPLLAQVPADAVLLVPAQLAPAAAQRRWLVMPQSLGAHVRPAQVTHVIDDGSSVTRELRPDQSWRPHGRVLDERGAWTLMAVEPAD